MSSSRTWPLAGLLCVAGCNQVFGLESTQAKPPIDAQYFDAAIDAPFACPPIGTTPHFATLLHQPILQMCSDYTIGEGHAIGYCTGFAEGDPDMPLTQVTGIAPTTATAVAPRLSPEGDEVFVFYVAGRSVPGEIHAYHPQSASAWTHAYQVQTPFTLQPAARAGVPSMGSPRRMMVLNNNTISELVVDSSGVATLHDTYSAADLGLFFMAGAPNLTPDGLRLVMPAITINGSIQRAVYSDRPSLDARFRPAEEIDAFAFVSDPFMTADCGRIYFSAVKSVLFVQRRD